MLHKIHRLFLLLTFVSNVSSATENGWLFAEQRVRNAVVQIWTQSASFNWLTPYKSPESAEWVGSGFFIDRQGSFLTNYHVVREAKTVYITIPEMGRAFLKADIVGTCPELDIALLRLTKESLLASENSIGNINALEFGDSDTLFQTQPVIAFGYPKGNRTMKAAIGEMAGHDFLFGKSLIHVTALTNQGNSGGPVLTQDGKVIGIVVAGLLNSQGYNFIIPSNEVLIVLSDLYTNKLVRKPQCGMGIQRSTEAHALSAGNPLPQGLYITQIFKDSMEEKAGLRAGDMLYEVIFNQAHYSIDEYGDTTVPWRDGQKISLEELLGRCRINDTISFIIYRNGEKKILKSVFENRKLLPVRSIYPEFEPKELDYEMIGGMVIMQLRQNHLDRFHNEKNIDWLNEYKQFELAENRSKNVLVITSILAGSQTYLTECLFAGFILDKINGKTVTNLQEFRDALLLSVEKNQIVINTKDKATTVLNLTEVLEDEVRLSQDFLFPITETVRKLIDKHALVKRKK